MSKIKIICFQHKLLAFLLSLLFLPLIDFSFCMSIQYLFLILSVSIMGELLRWIGFYIYISHYIHFVYISYKIFQMGSNEVNFSLKFYRFQKSIESPTLMISLTSKNIR